MKKVLLILIFLFYQMVFSQHGLRFSSTEFFTTSISIDPTSSIKEHGLDIVAELEYSGLIYTKVGFESFSALHGGYRDVHATIGINLTTGLYEKTRFYSGIRFALVSRGHEGAFRPIFGIEGGIDYDLTNNFFIGFRGTIDKRYDQEIFNWPSEFKGSGFIRVGYKWYYKKHRI